MIGEKVTLYHFENNGDLFILRAYLNGSSLVLEGQDFSKVAEEGFGDEKYEYYYSFDPENTEKLKTVFNTDDILNALVFYFNNDMNNKKFRELCDSNDLFYIIHII